MTIATALVTAFAAVVAAMSPAVFAAIFVLGMMAAIIAGGVWIFRRDAERSGSR